MKCKATDCDYEVDGDRMLCSRCLKILEDALDDSFGEYDAVAMIKGDQRWVFRFKPGDVNGVVDLLADAAQNLSCDFDVIDAQICASQIGPHASDRLAEVMHLE